MRNIIIFGTGIILQRTKDRIDKERYNIIEYWDNDKSKWGQKIDGITIVEPSGDYKGADSIIVMNSYWDEIYEQLTGKLGIPAGIIYNFQYFDKEILYEKYSDSDDEDIQNILSYIKSHNLQAFNFPWVEEYTNCKIDVFLDSEIGLYYCIQEGKRLYMKRSLNTVEKVRSYYRSLLIEQDKRSPHCYWKNDLCYQGKTVIDLGCAEGNYSLHIIDEAAQCIIVESDEEWIEALQYTFANYKNKVSIINKYAGNEDDDGTISLKNIVLNDGKSNGIVIKMDIEGAEESVISGLKDCKTNFKDLELLVCVYHHSGAERYICNILKELGFIIEINHGYIFFSVQSENETVKFRNSVPQVELRRCLIRAKHS